MRDDSRDEPYVIGPTFTWCQCARCDGLGSVYWNAHNEGLGSVYCGNMGKLISVQCPDCGGQGTWYEVEEVIDTTAMVASQAAETIAMVGTDPTEGRMSEQELHEALQRLGRSLIERECGHLQVELEQLRAWQARAMPILENFLDHEDHQGSYCWKCGEFDNKHKPDCIRVIGRGSLAEGEHTK